MDRFSIPQRELEVRVLPTVLCKLMVASRSSLVGLEI